MSRSSLAFEGMAAMGKALRSRPPHLGLAMPIRTYLDDHSAFEPDKIDALSRVLDEVCKTLDINGQDKDREIIAARIIDMARNGIVDAETLRERVLSETKALRSP